MAILCLPRLVAAETPISIEVAHESPLSSPQSTLPLPQSLLEQPLSQEGVKNQTVLLETVLDQNLDVSELQAQADNLGTDFNTPEGDTLESEGDAPNSAPQDRPLTEDEIKRIKESLENIQKEIKKQSRRGRSSPAITISNPAGFGADNFTAFANFNFQERVRRAPDSDATAGFGIGFGDARKNIGVQISYSLASFGQIGRSFGTGGFNAKIHRQFPGRWAVAVGAEGLINLGDDNDFEDTFYGSVSKIINLRQDVNQPFSRLALTAGVGTGRFRLEDDFVADRTTVSPFGTATILVARPVSTIVEWTGQDLAVGLSVAPFRKIPLVISPAIRDILGAGENPRFIISVGMSWKF
ncbi:hypothetical protein I1H34_14905 [Acaryochloris marina S15]|nr:hypothetical protein I1H34_14905 [Acaryochloris marina S15]